ncbi:MAG: dephospho-CoA kinase [Coriobacteriales bacterium]|jgi:dephospho-CoA kinase|nr:dephospho-CoA kinase [Coriobacteriales bacterium]
MNVVFVTGGLAAGKQTACRYLQQTKGASYLDADGIAKDLLEDELVIERLVQLYGSTIRNAKGDILRGRLAELAFVSPEASQGLNMTIWPRVKEVLADILIAPSVTQEGGGSFVLVEIAMLAEAPDFCDLADYILVIRADEPVRIQRALDRGMNLVDIKNRLALQASDAQRAALANLVITNNGSKQALYQQLDTWYDSFFHGRLF